MKNLINRNLKVLIIALFWLAPTLAEEVWFERFGQAVSLVGGIYAVNAVHESAHLVIAEALGHDGDLEIHPLTGQTEVEADDGHLNSTDRALIAVSGPMTTRLTYELLNGYLTQRSWDWLSPFLHWTALGLRLDLPWQQLKAGWSHIRGDEEDRREDDMNQFYDSLTGGTTERRLLPLIGGALSFWDLWTDANEIMTHISGGLGEKPIHDNSQRHWSMTSDGSNFFVNWRWNF